VCVCGVCVTVLKVMGERDSNWGLSPASLPTVKNDLVVQSRVLRLLQKCEKYIYVHICEGSERPTAAVKCKYSTAQQQHQHPRSNTHTF